MALRLLPAGRTQGDGMEKPEAAEHTVVLQPKRQIQKKNSRDNAAAAAGATAVQSSPSAIKLTPQAVSKKKSDLLINLKNKEPKFVPYEPYKAAVNPIVPDGKKHFRPTKKKKPKDIPGIFQKRETLAKETETPEAEATSADEDVKSAASGNVDWESRSKSLELELQVVKQENEQLENQLKFQVQVNGELKNLLVAAVGEDMETKVHVLTEDKLHLAQALLKSAKSLSSHQEQTEWLAGQCEVWRSKFLASSVMVEELARWKAALTQKFNEAQDALKKLLEERKRLRDNLLAAYRNLSCLRNNFDLVNKKTSLASSNALDLSDENRKMSESLLVQLLGSGVDAANAAPEIGRLPVETAAEKAAEHVITNPHLLQLFGEPDAACSAVVGAAVALSGQLYLQSHPPKIECCPQCSGDIKLV